MQAAEAVAAALGWPDAPVIATIHGDDPMARFVRDRVADETRTVAEYFGAALSVTNLLDQLLVHQGRDWRRLDAVLDFAAGCGRVTRMLLQRGTATFYAEAIDPKGKKVIPPK